MSHRYKKITIRKIFKYVSVVRKKRFCHGCDEINDETK